MKKRKKKKVRENFWSVIFAIALFMLGGVQPEAFWIVIPIFAVMALASWKLRNMSLEEEIYGQHALHFSRH